MSEQGLFLLRAHAKLAPWNARGLAAHATMLAESAGMRPTNAAARAALSSRGVRFYVANGLLDRPEGRGTAATYGYRHLLQLLAIKIRQREGQTLDVIKRELAQVTGDSLERRVALALAPSLSSAAASDTPESAVHPEAPDALWRRIAIAPGVELLLRNDAGVDIDTLRRTVRSAVGYDEP